MPTGDDLQVDVLIPTCDRPAALAVTLGCLIGQTHPALRVVVSDQGERVDADAVPEVRAVGTVLALAGRPVEIRKHLPRQGMAEQRQFLLDQTTAPYALFLDDDVITEPDLIERMVRAIRRHGCGLIGSFVNAPSAVDSAKPVDTPPPDLALELWEAEVRPELVTPDSPEWGRHRLHFAAYLHHLGCQLGISKDDERVYKIAWSGGCVLFDVEKLRSVGGFSFWEELPPEHCGEDVLAQTRVMEAYGGAGLVPSGAWHQEVPTTVTEREVDAPLVLTSAEQ